MTTRYGASSSEIGQLLSAWGEPAYRLRQIWDGLYRRRAPLEELTDLSLALRDRLAEALPLALTPVHTSSADKGETLRSVSSSSGARRRYKPSQICRRRYLGSPQAASSSSISLGSAP